MATVSGYVKVSKRWQKLHFWLNYLYKQSEAIPVPECDHLLNHIKIFCIKHIIWVLPLEIDVC